MSVEAGGPRGRLDVKGGGSTEEPRRRRGGEGATAVRRAATALQCGTTAETAGGAGRPSGELTAARVDEIRKIERSLTGLSSKPRRGSDPG